MKPRIYWHTEYRMWACYTPPPEMHLGLGMTPYMAYLAWQYR